MISNGKLLHTDFIESSICFSFKEWEFGVTTEDATEKMACHLFCCRPYGRLYKLKRTVLFMLA